MEDVNRGRRIFFLSKLEHGPQEVNSREFAYMWYFNRIRILKRDKVWKNANSFKSDVFAAIAVVDAKAPYLCK